MTTLPVFVFYWLGSMRLFRVTAGRTADGTTDDASGFWSSFGS